jgi:MFS family permease
MFGVLLVAYMLMAADRYLFPVLAPDVRREFGLSLADTGLLTTIFTLGLGLGVILLVGTAVHTLR